METKSQRCTDIVQSRRLVSLGLKRETADMSLDWSKGNWEASLFTYEEATAFSFDFDKKDLDSWVFPAWSLDRLLELAFDQNCEHADRLIFSKDNSQRYDEVIKFLIYLIDNNYINPEYTIYE